MQKINVKPIHWYKRLISNNVSCVGGFFFMDGTAEINNIKLEISHSNTFGEGEFRLYGVK